ncbi:MAG: hypothetical protein LBE12_14670 [Planctomycetaceae bacterium]|jgi:hypothetical protein|nr:hypothetical protein [Planctomycetaceae bacterium]
MRQINRIFSTTTVAVLLVLLFSTSTVYAGMTFPTLSKYGADRFIGISTAVFIVMVIAAIPVMFCWNALVADSPHFKRLNYPKALGLVFLGGCFFSLVLAMVAGSRELFSPGAWIPNGIVSQTVFDAEREQLAKTKNSDELNLEMERLRAITTLRNILQKFAQEHDGQLPASIEESRFGNLWFIPFAAGISYDYFPNADSPNTPLVREPAIVPNARWTIDRNFLVTENFDTAEKVDVTEKSP